MDLFREFLFINSFKRFEVRELRSNKAEPKYPAFDTPDNGLFNFFGQS